MAYILMKLLVTCVALGMMQMFSVYLLHIKIIGDVYFPKMTVTWLNIYAGNELFKQQKYPEAVQHYTEALKRNPKDPKVLFPTHIVCLTMGIENNKLA